jgi:hypothetical protein
MDLCQIREIPLFQSSLRYAQLVRQLPNRRPPHSQFSLFFPFERCGEGVGTTSVRPHGREGDLLVGTFLEEEGAVGRAEEEDGECTVQETLTDVGHEVACGVRGHSRQWGNQRGGSSDDNSKRYSRPERGNPRLTSLLATLAVRHILIVYQDTPLFHQPDLLFIVGLEIYVCLQSTGNGLGGGGRGCSVGMAGWGDGGVRFGDGGHRFMSVFL